MLPFQVIWGPLILSSFLLQLLCDLRCCSIRHLSWLNLEIAFTDANKELSKWPLMPFWFAQRELGEHKNLYHIYSLLVSLPLATSNILLQLYPHFYCCSTPFVTLVLTLIDQNFHPPILLTAEIRHSPPITVCFPPTSFNSIFSFPLKSDWRLSDVIV